MYIIFLICILSFTLKNNVFFFQQFYISYINLCLYRHSIESTIVLLKQDGMQNSGMNSPMGQTMVIVNGTYSSPHLYQLHMQHFRSLSIP